MLLIIYGLRRGEVLGLSWDDIDFDTGTIHVRQQIQRVRGELQLGPVKTHAGQRTLPLLDLARQALAAQANRQAAYQADMGSAWQGTGLIFTTRTGRPVEPRNFVRSFRRRRDSTSPNGQDIWRRSELPTWESSWPILKCLLLCRR